MKIANNLILSTGFAMLIQCIGTSASAIDNYKTFRRDFWEFETATQFFRSEANFSSGGGSFSRLPSGNYFQQLDLSVGSRFVADKNFAFYGYLNTGNSESKSGNITRSNSALSQFLAGLEYLVYSSGTQVVLEAGVLAPLESYKANGDSVMNNEGVIEVRPAITVQSDFEGSVLWFGKAGLTYRDQGRSYLLPWRVGGEYKLPSARVGALLSGFQSITDDKDVSNSGARLATSNNVNAGSLKWNAINPSVISTEAYYRFKISEGWVGQVQAGADLTGTSYASGFFVGAFVRYAFDISSWYREVPYEINETKVERPSGKSQMYGGQSTLKKEEFKENVDDGVDQKIFRLKPITPEPSTGSAQSKDEDAGLKIKMKRVKKKKR